MSVTYELNRTMIGQCHLDNAIALDDIKNADDVEEKLLSLDELKNKLDI